MICQSCQSELQQTRWGIGGLHLADCRIPLVWRDLYGSLLTESILSAKFRGQWSKALYLGGLLGELPKPWMGEDPLLVPVPLAPKRLASRGFNQSVMIAQSLARVWKLKFSRTALIKTRSTVRQATLSKARRSQNLEGSFFASSALNGKRVLLIDDIMTTGATLREAAAAVAAAGGQVIAAAVIAKVDQQSNTPGSHGRPHPRVSHRPRRARNPTQHR
jgi:ComF family protein